MNTINKDLICHRAQGECEKCHSILISNRGGEFSACQCGNFIDQERFSAMWVRHSMLINVKQECPPTCKIEGHKQ
jgi:hypothetical protein